MTLKEVETFLKEKCVSYTTNTYNYINAEIAIKDLNECTSLIMVDKIGIRFMEFPRNDCNSGMYKYTMLDFYLYNSVITSMDISKIKALAYVEWNKPKEVEPITMEQTLDKLYELIEPFIVKVAKDIYKEIKNDKS